MIDSFMFNGELDMLECRLREFEQYEDVVHLISENSFTHRGQPKPFHFAEHRERFQRWESRIAYLPWSIPGPDPWAVEHAQRDVALRWLTEHAEPEDMVLVCDVDEFPDIARCAQAVFHYGAVTCRMRLCMYAVDWQYPERHPCSVAAQWAFIDGRSLASLRDSRDGLPAVDCGIHLTWLGGVEAQRRKLSTTCHTEMTPAQYDLIASGRSYQEGRHHSGTLDMLAVDVDSTWPRWVAERQCPASWFRPRAEV